MYWMHAITPVHIGTGAQVGYVDLPIAREKSTNWPVVPGSGLKGVVADNFGASDTKKRPENALLAAAFGQADDKASEAANSGALVFTDGRLVCLPVRSVLGTFAWATTELALKRLGRDLEAAGIAAPGPVPKTAKDEEVLIPDAPKSKLASPENQVYLADLDFAAKAEKEAGLWAKSLAEWIFPGDGEWQTVFKERFVVLHGDTFNYFAETATEVSTRVRIDPDTKAVATGQLWTEESLPAEAVMAGLIWCDRLFTKKVERTAEQMLEHFCGKALNLQVGGKATVGRGRVKVSFSGGAK
jgi:CRISPR-associated protein Cmr4